MPHAQPSPPVPRSARLPSAVVLLLALVCLSGCQGGPGGTLTLRGADGQGRPLAGNFDLALYSVDTPDSITVVLVEGTLDQPTQAVTLRMLWRPRAGKTPLDSDAVNATIRCMVFADQEIGVYSGAGFVYPSGDPGDQRLGLSIWSSTLTLADRSAGFRDLLGLSTLRGAFTVESDAAGTRAALRQLHQAVSRRLGYPMLVRADTASLAAGANAR